MLTNVVAMLLMNHNAVLTNTNEVQLQTEPNFDSQGTMTFQWAKDAIPELTNIDLSSMTDSSTTIQLGTNFYHIEPIVITNGWILKKI